MTLQMGWLRECFATRYAAKILATTTFVPIKYAQRKCKKKNYYSLILPLYKCAVTRRTYHTECDAVVTMHLYSSCCNSNVGIRIDQMHSSNDGARKISGYTMYHVCVRRGKSSILNFHFHFPILQMNRNILK